MTEQEEFEFRARFEAEQAAKQQPASLRQKIQASGPMRAVQGMRDPLDAAAQLLPRGAQFLTSGAGFAPNPVSEFFGSEAKRVDQLISQNEREYVNARKATGSDGFDAWRMGGNIVSPANAAIAARLPAAASTIGRVGQGFLLGGVGGALQPVDVEENPDFVAKKLAQIALGAGVGMVATPLMGAIGDKIARFVSGKFESMKGPRQITIANAAKEFAEGSGLVWDDLSDSSRVALQKEVTKAVQDMAGANPQVAARIADFKALKIPYTQGQVTRDPLQFASEKNLSQLAGTGDPLRARFMEQGAALQDRMRNFASGAIEEQPAGQALVNALRAYDEKLSSNVRAAYRQARDSAGKDVEVPMQGLSQDFAEVVNTFADKVPAGVRNNFARFGIGADDAQMTQRRLFTVEEAEKLLKVINANQSNDPATNAALSALRGAVKKAVTQDAGAEDVFAPARAAAAQRFSLQDAVPALEAAASGVVNPDTFVKNFILGKSAQTGQVRQMAEILRQESPEAFAQARAQIGAYLQRKAFGENLTGDKTFSAERYQTALRELGSDKVAAFFDPGELAQLQRLSRVGSYMESFPNASRPNTSGNWGAITSLAQNFPGIPQSLALVNALRNSAGNQMAVSQALSGKVPRQLSPEEVSLVSKLLAGGSLATGAAAANQIK